MLSIESVIKEKFPNFTDNKPIASKTVIKALRIICHESKFKQFKNQYPHVEGFDFVEQALDFFDFSFRVKDNEKCHIPTQGKVVIIANHPIGSLDGLALLKLIGDIRPDVKAVANEVLYSLKPLRSVLLPVDNMTGKSGKDQLKAIKDHLNDEGAIIIFPAGEVSRMSPTGIKDGRWNHGFLRFAKAADAPILPIFVDGRNSIFFYSLSLIAKPVSTLWLIREMFKQSNNDIDFSVGHMVYPEQYKELPISPQALAKLFKKHVYTLPKKNRTRIPFASEFESIAHPEERQRLKKEIEQCELLGETADNKRIYLYQYQANTAIMRELGRLREVSFRAVKEGSGKKRDTDSYDQYYDHLVLWDNEEIEIVGAYRMARCSEAEIHSDIEKPLYTQTLYDFNTAFKEKYFPCGVELGRSFIQPKFQGRKSLSYLWQGIGAYLKRHPDVRYLFGPVSLSHDYPQECKDLLISFYYQHFGTQSNWVNSQSPYGISPERQLDLINLFPGKDYKAEFKILKAKLKEHGMSVPTLYKQYGELGGVEFHAFNIDKDFGDCIDSLVVVDIQHMDADKRKNYLDQ